jgi:UDP-4-amino-4,6-dideoxy-N-acetyl-beta-L-altrosamine transaminase
MIKTNSFIPYGKQCIEEDDIAAVVKTLKSDWLTQGPMIAEFEKAVARKTGARYAVAVATGTAALHCACFAAGVKEGDEIITSPITFAASGNCALFLGGSVRFVDINPATYCMDVQKLEAAIRKKTKAVIPVDFTGQPCDIEEINAIASKHNLRVIEDAAHSLGATYNGKPVGSLAEMTIFSFHPVKLITTGEGGMIVTNSEVAAKKLRLFRTHGITNNDEAIIFPRQAADNENIKQRKKNYNTRSPWYYEMQELGYNYRITDLQCALGLNQLRKLERFVTRRRMIAKRYNEAFAQSPYLVTPYVQPNSESAWHLYVLRLRLEKMSKTRREVFEELRSSGIGVQIHYIPLHLQPYYRHRFGYKRGDFPEAEAYYDSSISLPLFPGMSEGDCERVISCVLKSVK